MDQFPQALYRMPGKDVQTDDGWCAYSIANSAEDLEAALADGWHETSPAAAEAFEAAKCQQSEPASATAPTDDAAPPTRAELEQKAAELGLKFDGRTGDKRLAALIAEKLAAP